MKISIIAVGNRMPDWIATGVTEYLQRMPREASVELIEVKPEKRDKGELAESLLRREAPRIDAKLRKVRPKIVLDERGELWSTKKLATFLQDAMTEGQQPGFVIGSADGLDESIKAAADHRIALSRLTLPHGLVRVMLAEQLYRAVSILQNHPYHRE